MTKRKPAPSANAALARLDFFGDPPLLEGEDSAAYNELLVQIAMAVKPADVLEEIWVRDIINLTWEIFRWHRTKTNLIAANKYKGVKAVLEPIVEFLVADSLVQGWARRDTDDVKEVENRLSSAGVTTAAIMAQAIVAVLAEIGSIDRMAMNAEARRNAALHEIERHRMGFGRALRQVSDEVVAEYDEVNAPQIEDQKAA